VIESIPLRGERRGVFLAMTGLTKRLRPKNHGGMTLKVIAVNGSPRKKWNTAILLEKALEGAASAGAKTEAVHLYDLSFKGCVSCFACKIVGGKSYGRCAVKDDLEPLLEEAAMSDALILGSPIYFGSVTGEMRSFMERLLFPYLAYTSPPRSLFPRTIDTGCGMHQKNGSRTSAGSRLPSMSLSSKWCSEVCRNR